MVRLGHGNISFNVDVKHLISHIEMSCITRKTGLTKSQISCAVTAQLISAFVFATRIVQFLLFLDLEFKASSFFL